MPEELEGPASLLSLPVLGRGKPEYYIGRMEKLQNLMKTIRQLMSVSQHHSIVKASTTYSCGASCVSLVLAGATSAGRDDPPPSDSPAGSWESCCMGILGSSHASLGFPMPGEGGVVRLSSCSGNSCGE